MPIPSRITIESTPNFMILPLTDLLVVTLKRPARSRGRLCNWREVAKISFSAEESVKFTVELLPRHLALENQVPHFVPLKLKRVGVAKHVPKAQIRTQANA